MRALLLCVFVAVGCTPREESDPRFLGVVASASPEASAVGRRVLESGGNAIDAAIAVSFALGVTEPAMSGLGGQTQILLFAPETQGVVINGSSFSPRATPPDAVEGDLVGRRATTVPTTVKVLDFAHRRYGSGKITWRELVEPAIELADNGFSLGPFRRKVLARHADQLRREDTTGALFVVPPEENFRQPLLADTLRWIAAHGADVFYEGEIAQAIAEDMERHGGWIRLEDLAGLPEPEEVEPLRATYRGYDVLGLPPPGGGWVVLQMLEMLESFESSALSPSSPDRIGLLTRVLHLGHRERRRNPVENLEDYADEIDERLTGEAVRRLLDGSGGETTHFSIVDADGMAVSVTASINAFYGARVAHPSLGFLYNDYMNEFVIGRPGHPFNLRPEAMPYSSMSPTILVDDGRAQLVLGSPGSARIISAVTQVIQLWVDGGLPLEQAVSYPRFHVDAEGELFVEAPDRFHEAIEPLATSALVLHEASDDLANEHGNPFFGGVHAVGYENGRWVGAADPRRDGEAVVVTEAPVGALR